MANVYTLILAILTVESSYLQEVERPTSNVPDTVQFWYAPDSQWRIKTFAIDHDVHVYQIDPGVSGVPLTAQFAENNIKKTYGDVTASVIVMHFTDPKNQVDVQHILTANKLSGTLEEVKNGYCFYNPDRGVYRTKSKPK